MILSLENTKFNFLLIPNFKLSLFNLSLILLSHFLQNNQNLRHFHIKNDPNHPHSYYHVIH